MPPRIHLSESGYLTREPTKRLRLALETQVESIKRKWYLMVSQMKKMIQEEKH